MLVAKKQVRRRSGNPAARSASTGLWHGGVPGLVVGDRLLPPSRTRHRIVTHEAIPYEHDPTSVYVTNEKQFARTFAAQYIRDNEHIPGDVYAVRPVGDLLGDPDYALGDEVSFRCSEAVVVAVVERGVRLSGTQLTRLHAPWARWTDGTPMYDPDGYLTLSPEGREAGLRPEVLRMIDPWLEWTEATEQLMDLQATGVDIGIQPTNPTQSA